MQDHTISLEDVFDTLTAKQRETIELLGEGWTSKEMAHALGISESAVIQRIETLRAKTGGMLRKDLARAWRDHTAREEPPLGDCKDLTGKIFQVSPDAGWPQEAPQDHFDNELELADAMPFEAPAPWARSEEPEVVPEMLDGRDAVFRRSFLAIGMAVGMLVAMLVLLSVASEVGELL